MNFLTIFGLILGATEEIVPIFIHNSNSQRIEGAIVTTTNNLFSTILALQQGQRNAMAAQVAQPVTPATSGQFPATPASQAA